MNGGRARSRHPRRPVPETERPLYARALRLHRLRPGAVLCFLFFEGSIVVGILLALAELVPWWGAIVLCAVVAAMVKVNDMIAGTVGRPARRTARAGSHERRSWAGGDRRRGDRRRWAPQARVAAARRVAAAQPAGPAVGMWPAGRGVGVPPAGAEVQFADGDADTVAFVRQPPSRQRPASDVVDSPWQRSRQSASRRYE